MLSDIIKFIIVVVGVFILALALALALSAFFAYGFNTFGGPAFGWPVIGWEEGTGALIIFAVAGFFFKTTIPSKR